MVKEGFPLRNTDSENKGLFFPRRVNTEKKYQLLSMCKVCARLRYRVQYQYCNLCLFLYTQLLALGVSIYSR